MGVVLKASGQTNTNRVNLLSSSNLFYLIRFDPTNRVFTNGIIVSGSISVRSNNPAIPSYLEILDQDYTNPPHAYAYALYGSNGVFKITSGFPVGFQYMSFSNNANLLYILSDPVMQPTIGLPTAPYNINASNVVASGLVIATNGLVSYRSNTLNPTAVSPFPASNVAWVNTNNCNIEVYLNTNGVATITQIKKNGTVIANQLNSTLTLGLQPGESFTITYTGSVIGWQSPL